MDMIEVTTVIGCKNMCSYCPQAITIKNYGNNERVMTPETFRKCIDNIKEDVAISFSGFAEPFQNENAMAMILHAYAKGHPIRLNTTLAGMTKNDIELLKDIEIQEFIVHLQTKEEHFVEMAKYLQLLELLCAAISNMRFVYNGGLDERVISILKEHNYKPVQLEIKSRAGALFKQKHKKGRIFCDMKKEIGDNILLPNGDVVLCCMDFGLKHKLGNLLTQRFEELHSNSDWKELKKKFDEHDNDLLCRQCELSTAYLSLKFPKHIVEKFIYKKWRAMREK